MNQFKSFEEFEKWIFSKSELLNEASAINGRSDLLDALPEFYKYYSKSNEPPETDDHVRLALFKWLHNDRKRKESNQKAKANQQTKQSNLGAKSSQWEFESAEFVIQHYGFDRSPGWLDRYRTKVFELIRERRSGCKECHGSGIVSARDIKYHGQYSFLCSCPVAVIAGKMPENSRDKIRQWYTVTPGEFYID